MALMQFTPPPGEGSGVRLPQNGGSPRSSVAAGASTLKKRRLPTLPRVCSTIGAGGLNFSVRNGKRWNPATVATLIWRVPADNGGGNGPAARQHRTYGLTCHGESRGKTRNRNG